LYTILYGLVFALLVIPWAYYIPKEIRYSFLPRQLIFVLMSLVLGLIWIRQDKLIQKMTVGAIFVGLFALQWVRVGYPEPHDIFEFLYLEIALLIVSAPVEIKEKMLRYSSIILYVVLAKAFFFRMGTYVHGGFNSSNLYGTYIVFLCFIEVARRRYWNLIPAFLIIYVVGSKACYMASIVLVLYAAYTYLESKGKLQQTPLVAWKSKIESRLSFYWPFLFAAAVIFVFTQIMTRTEYYKNWSKSMEPSRAETTRNNMIMYGLIQPTAPPVPLEEVSPPEKLPDGKEKKRTSLEEEELSVINKKDDPVEHERKVLLRTKEMQFNDSKMSLSAPPLITDVGMSAGLRLTQYQYMFQNLGKYFFTGDTIGSQSEMYGHNPHSSFPDFVSRLGLLYLLLVLILYVRLFKFMNLLFFNLGVLPILAFQPYGFTIGHSIVILALAYALTKQALESRQSSAA
jgi:hypothetical protein